MPQSRTTGSPTMEEDSRSDDSNHRRVLLDADELVTRYNLDQFRDVLRMGALSAAGLSASEHVEGLTPAEEKGILRNERPVKPNSLPWSLTYVFPSCWALFLRMIISDCVPYVCSALFGCWCTPLLNRLWGRRGTMTAGSTCAFIAEVWLNFLFPFVYFRHWIRWLLFSLLMLMLGLGIGVTTCTVPIYLAETNPLPYRGNISFGWTPYAPCSKAIVVFVALFHPIFRVTGFLKAPRIWGSVIAGILPILPWLAAESPRWYMAHGHIDKAYQSLRSLRETDVSAAEELYSIYARAKFGSQPPGHDNFRHRFVQLFTVPHIRRATLASVVATISASLSGPGFTVAMFALAAFETDGELLSMEFAKLFAIDLFMLVVIVSAAMLGSVLMGYVKRRRLLLVSLFLLSIIFLVAWRLSFIIPRALVVLCFVSVAIAAIGPSTVPSAYTAEVFPTYHREFGVALSVAICQGCQVLLRVFTGYVYQFISPALLVFVCWLMVFLFMEESKHLTLEDMHLTFQHSTRTKVSYRLFTQFPYAFKRYALRKKVRLQPTEDRNAGYTYTPYTDEEAISLAS